MNSIQRMIMYIFFVIVLTVAGFTQTQIGSLFIQEIPGSMEDNSIEITGFDHQIYLPYSAEQGTITGSPVVGMVTINKLIDISTPQILQHFHEAVLLREAEITLYKVNPETRRNEPDYILLLYDVLITEVTNMRDEDAGQNVEIIKLYARKIRWTHVRTNLEYEIDTRPVVAKPGLYNPNIGKIYIYDDTGTLIDGTGLKVEYSSLLSDFSIESIHLLDSRGTPTGRVISEAYMLRKEIDGTSIRLLELLYENKALARIRLALERINKDGILEEYMWYDFEKVHLVSSQANTLPTEDQQNGNYPFTESIYFLAEKMTWEHISGQGGTSSNPFYNEFFGNPFNDLPLSINVNNYPNPFNAQTRIEYNLPAEITGKSMTISIYDISGRLIRNLFRGVPPSNKSFVIWDGMDVNRKPVSSGTYFYMIKAGEELKTGKIMHLK